MDEKRIQDVAYALIKELLIHSSAVIAEGKQTDSMVFSCKGENCFGMQINCSNEHEKAFLYERINKDLKNNKPDFCMLVSEMWVGECSPEDLASGNYVPPRDNPNHIECLVFMVKYDYGGFSEIYKIDRSEEVPQLKKYEDLGKIFSVTIFDGVFEEACHGSNYIQ